jgi:hypothetical protein
LPSAVGAVDHVGDGMTVLGVFIVAYLKPNQKHIKQNYQNKSRDSCGILKDSHAILSHIRRPKFFPKTVEILVSRISKLFRVEEASFKENGQKAMKFQRVSLLKMTNSTQTGQFVKRFTVSILRAAERASSFILFYFFLTKNTFEYK